MKFKGELLNDKIIVKKLKDIGQLYNKSNFGKIISGNILELDLIEGIFLNESNKIDVFRDKKELGFKELLKIATKQYDEFLEKYLVFKDLRKRGIQIKICEEESFTFKQIKLKNIRGSNYIVTFSERSMFDISSTIYLLKKTGKSGSNLWYAIVDEEGDITYYDLNRIDLKGDIKKNDYKKDESLILKNRAIIFDKNLSEKLHKHEFFGKPFEKGLQLSLIEALYLYQNNIIDIDPEIKDLKNYIIKNQPDINERMIVFNDLKNRGLIVKTGFKFGTHFRAYTNKPDKTHAQYLIHVVNSNFKVMWEEISRAVRLAHSVNKEIFFARVSKNKKIDYVKFGRLRP